MDVEYSTCSQLTGQPWDSENYRQVSKKAEIRVHLEQRPQQRPGYTGLGRHKATMSHCQPDLWGQSHVDSAPYICSQIS